MSADEKLVERLRQIVATFNANGTAPSYAAAIDRAASALGASEAREAAKDAEIATLREALTPFARHHNAEPFRPGPFQLEDDDPVVLGIAPDWLKDALLRGDFRRARAALRQEGKP